MKSVTAKSPNCYDQNACRANGCEHTKTAMDLPDRIKEINGVIIMADPIPIPNRKRMVMPLKKVIDMAEWYLADNRYKHSRAAYVEMRSAITQMKTMRKRYAKI